MLQQLGLQLPKNLCPRFRAMQRLRYQRKLRLMLRRLQPRLWILCPCFHPSSKRRRLRNLGLEGPKMPPMLQKLGLQKRSLRYRIRPMQHFRFKWKLRLLLQRLQLSLRQMRPHTHWKCVTWLRKLGLGQPNLQAMLKQMGLKQQQKMRPRERQLPKMGQQRFLHIMLRRLRPQQWVLQPRKPIMPF